jgi:hypothetical protein
MVDYTITVNDVNNKVLGYVANSQQEWIENCVSARMISAKNEIINQLVAHCNQAFELGVVKLAKDRTPSNPTP